jgi:double-stranded uracil-DNA glycosylase
VGFTREQLAAFEGKTVDDLLGPDVRLLFVGINPGLWTAAPYLDPPSSGR